MRLLQFLLLLVFIASPLSAQGDWDTAIAQQLPEVLEKHRAFVGIPNVSAVKADMYKNIAFIQPEFEQRGFTVRLLESTSLPVFFAEKQVDKNAKTVLFYFHLDGQPVNAANWAQDNPFVPVLKQQNETGDWETIDWNNIHKEIDPEWRIFGRAAADDKGPITMMLTALQLLEDTGVTPNYNIKIILDLQEEAGSHGFISTLEQYKDTYAADYMIIMDGPAHPTNRPTLTFGCRGIATCSITVYGAKLPQHSGHFGNYAPNPIFSLSHLLASMKDDTGRVTIKGYYDGIPMDDTIKAMLDEVPDDDDAIQKRIGIHSPDAVGAGYQEALQYPSLNVRHIETSWKGPGLKTVIPEVVTAHIDVRLVAETDGMRQLQKIKEHITRQGYFVLDRPPTDEERRNHRKIVTFKANRAVNAFRTDMDMPFGQSLTTVLTETFGSPPVRIRTMGGTVPIIPAINTLNIPAIIVPMVNMDNNQHSPNENLRIGNLIQGIKTCMTILTMHLD